MPRSIQLPISDLEQSFTALPNTASAMLLDGTVDFSKDRAPIGVASRG